MTVEKPQLEICTGSRCGQGLFVKTREAVEDAGFAEEVDLIRAHCMGVCIESNKAKVGVRLPSCSNSPFSVDKKGLASFVSQVLSQLKDVLGAQAS